MQDLACSCTNSGLQLKLGRDAASSGQRGDLEDISQGYKGAGDSCPLTHAVPALAELATCAIESPHIGRQHVWQTEEYTLYYTRTNK